MVTVRQVVCPEERVMRLLQASSTAFVQGPDGDKAAAAAGLSDKN